jgi:hypothetical protein
VDTFFAARDRRTPGSRALALPFRYEPGVHNPFAAGPDSISAGDGVSPSEASSKPEDATPTPASFASSFSAVPMTVLSMLSGADGDGDAVHLPRTSVKCDSSVVGVVRVVNVSFSLLFVVVLASCFTNNNHHMQLRLYSLIPLPTSATAATSRKRCWRTR